MNSATVPATTAPPAPFDKPHVYLMDCNAAIQHKIEQARFYCESGSLGSLLTVAYGGTEQQLIKPRVDVAPNIHEFDVVVMDLTHSKREPFSEGIHLPKNISKELCVLCSKPQRTLDQKPFAVHSVAKGLQLHLAKQRVIIVFISNVSSATYLYVSIECHQRRVEGTTELTLFPFYESYVKTQAKSGRKIQILSQTKIDTVLEKYSDGMTYGTVFDIPVVRDSRSMNFIPDPKYTVFATNEVGEVVSYGHLTNDTTVLVFPDIQDKASFVHALLNNSLPEIHPTLFPHHTSAHWLENGDYPLPNQVALEAQRQAIQEECAQRVASVDAELLANKQQFQFLHDLLSGTGDALVTTVQGFLEWLGFESVRDMDQETDSKEEDLQVESERGLLVIEVKGIGGTSQDSECAQIGKIKYRRAKERGSFDVFPLYIVNHQRHRPPSARQNPPFNATQIDDAKNDERGLLTTYDLYKSYFLIESGLLRKEDMRTMLYGTGYLDLWQHFHFLGKPEEYLKDGTVIVLNIGEGITLKRGDMLCLRHNDQCHATQILSLQVDDETKESVVGPANVGIQISVSTPRSTELLLPRKPSAREE